MGQTESANSDDYSCFRACIKEKKAAGKKMEALPPFPGNKHSKIRQKVTSNTNRNPVKSQSTESTKKEKGEDEGFETSLDQRLAAETVRIKKNRQQQSFANVVAVEPKEPPIVEQQADPNNDIFLGLESKFIPKKILRYTSAQKPSSLKPSTLRMSVSPIQRYSSKKQYTSQDETASKSNHTSSSTQSRNILLNKIESIKQKYFQRQLEIEIYQDEKEYQRQIDQLNEIERTFTEDNSGLPDHSIGEIRAIRDKILKKLREKKNEKTQEQSITNNVFEDVSLDFRKNKVTSSHEELQIYSREERAADDTLNESQRSKKPKKMKKSLSYSGKLDKSLNKSSNGILPEVSVDEKMQFSQYSEESLHAIRQLDEQQQEYKSKMSPFPSGVHKKSFNAMKSFRKNVPSDVKNSIVSNKLSKLTGNQHCQQEEAQPAYYSRHNHISPPSRLTVCKEQQNSALSDYKSKQQSISGVHYSKNNKILLF